MSAASHADYFICTPVCSVVLIWVYGRYVPDNLLLKKKLGMREMTKV